ncbi:hypothetical protein BDA99DRAFT_53906 [Phascolomyces articulosus]|uniref:OTU domain-containing protein n=1 Tax=Phascolomyces articulosus TaxID=60185 RepID=A0AAD5KB26_9FUNG|nr:hypothetical protein BDA99DRAFT_53906 [Phascolomyces articulosus]
MPLSNDVSTQFLKTIWKIKERYCQLESPQQKLDLLSELDSTVEQYAPVNPKDITIPLISNPKAGQLKKLVNKFKGNLLKQLHYLHYQTIPLTSTLQTYHIQQAHQIHQTSPNELKIINKLKDIKTTKTAENPYTLQTTKKQEPFNKNNEQVETLTIPKKKRVKSSQVEARNKRYRKEEEAKKILPSSNDIPAKAIRKMVHIIGDGYCSFRAIAYNVYKDQVRHMIVQKQMLNFIMDPK